MTEFMSDAGIVALYWERDERALSETRDKYGRYLFKVAYNIVSNSEDSEEVVNDGYLKTWNTIPENRPASLAAYIGKIVREGAIDLWRRAHATKRYSGLDLAIDEMAETLGDGCLVEETVEGRQLSAVIADYLADQEASKRQIFLSRYYYMDSAADIARDLGLKEATVRSILLRMRRDLKKHLEERGFMED